MDLQGAACVLPGDPEASQGSCWPFSEGGTVSPGVRAHLSEAACGPGPGPQCPLLTMCCLIPSPKHLSPLREFHTPSSLKYWVFPAGRSHVSLSLWHTVNTHKYSINKQGNEWRRWVITMDKSTTPISLHQYYVAVPENAQCCFDMRLSEPNTNPITTPPLFFFRWDGRVADGLSHLPKVRQVAEAGSGSKPRDLEWNGSKSLHSTPLLLSLPRLYPD